MPDTQHHGLKLNDRNNNVPLHKLPTEILSEIFLAGLVSVTDGELTEYLNTVTSVCALWRNIAHSTNRLWTRIVWFLDDPTSPSHIDARIQRLRRCLEMSANAPLGIRLDYYETDSINCARVWQLICPHLSRCRSLSIGYYNRIEEFLPLPGRLVLLKELKLYGNVDSHKCPLFDEPEHCSLRSLSISAVLTTESTWLAHIPTKELMRVKLCVSLGSRLLNGVLGFLAGCDALTRLNLKTGYSDTILSDITHIVLPSLRVLNLAGTLSVDSQKWISAPNLEELILDGSMIHVSPPSMSEPISPLLRSLSVYLDWPLSAASLRTVLSACPAVTHLQIYQLPLPKALLDLLADLLDNRPESPSTLPLLEILRITSTSFDGLGLEYSVSELLRKRPKLYLSVTASRIPTVKKVEEILKEEFGSRFQTF